MSQRPQLYRTQPSRPQFPQFPPLKKPRAIGDPSAQRQQSPDEGGDTEPEDEDRPEEELSTDQLFTLSDVELLVRNINKFNNDKLQTYKGSHQPNNIVNITGVTEVFVTSDIHADYRKFVQILVAGGFINIPNVGDLYEANNIYNYRIIAECEWIKRDCLIVIAGDLVDGKRNSDGQVNDPIGCFELLLHMLIFNLRIKGNTMNSNILFTIGNHELETVIANTDVLYNYIHDNALRFFREKDNRSRILKEFYELNPYIYLVLSTPSMPNEVAILHGGLHDSNSEQIDKSGLNDLQVRINELGLSHLERLHSNPTTQTLAAKKNTLGNFEGALWTRFYVEQPERACTLQSDYALTVVGHCPTTMFSELSSILDKPDYYGCDSYRKNKMKGCVILNCLNNPDAPGLPKIALVDVSMSSAFTSSLGRHNDLEKVRGVELLHLKHIERPTSRWFNDIYRFEINFNCNKTIDIRPSQTGGSKNYKDKYYIYKAKYLNLMKNLKI
jgi:hypothetical protein